MYVFDDEILCRMHTLFGQACAARLNGRLFASSSRYRFVATIVSLYIPVLITVFSSMMSGTKARRDH